MMAGLIRQKLILKIALLFFIPAILFLNCEIRDSKGNLKMGISDRVKNQTIQSLVDMTGDSHRQSIEVGVSQVAARWSEADGSEKEFTEFCEKYFVSDSLNRDIVFYRFQQNLETLYGNLHQIARQFRWALDVEKGPIYPIDYLFVNYEPFAHVSQDVFQTKLAFAALLNFPLENLETKNSSGMDWSRKKWAETRLAEEFAVRVPSEIAQKRSETYTLADDYISNYNIYMHHLLDDSGNRLFPEGLKLISHWGLRDELKAQYANSEGVNRQRMIQKVMERIILQEIPQPVINSDQYDWNPYQNEVFLANRSEKTPVKPESTMRYQHIRNIFLAEKMLDPYYPHAPSLIDRRFQINREMSEQEVETLLKSVLSAPVVTEIAALIQSRLGRPLEPFDIWYTGFKPRSELPETELDKKVGKLYPTVNAFQKDIPYILRKTGFSPEKAEFLADHIAVDPSRGAGHAMGAMMRDDQAHLRTRIPPDGMKYKGFNIAIHELGHNVEQVFSLNGMDYYTLNGVPNTAFTEAFAFVFQSRDLQVLGLGGQNAQGEHLTALNDLWATFEISGVALTDMYIWRWMYEHPEADAEQLKSAMLNITQGIWNEYFAPVLGMKDQILLAIYSHIVDGGMYTPDYPLGHIISFQIEDYLKNHSLAVEMERMCKIGRLSPQIWMQKAIGQKISVDPLIKSAEEAMKHMSSGR